MQASIGAVISTCFGAAFTALYCFGRLSPENGTWLRVACSMLTKAKYTQRCFRLIMNNNLANRATNKIGNHLPDGQSFENTNLEPIQINPNYLTLARDIVPS